MHNGRKGCGVADIVFLLDATGSMEPCIDDVRNCIVEFLSALKSPVLPYDQTPLTDWRAAVFAYRDYAADGADNWFVTNPFTRDPVEVWRQLASLVATGGGDEPEDLLDALCKVASMGSTEKRSPEDPWRWRHRLQAARYVVVFTDATFHGCSADGLKYEGPLASSPDLTGEDVREIVERNRLTVTVYAPAFEAHGWHGFELLSSDVTRLVCERIPFNEGQPQAALTAFTHDLSNFRPALARLAHAIYASTCAAWLVEDWDGETSS